jgi:hypothetical protein
MNPETRFEAPALANLTGYLAEEGGAGFGDAGWHLIFPSGHLPDF